MVDHQPLDRYLRNGDPGIPQDLLGYGPHITLTAVTHR
jgi:hypothetical protein